MEENYKFDIGEDIFINSRYDGIVKRIVVSQFLLEDGTKCYELDKLVEIRKNGSTIGSKKEDLGQVEYDSGFEFVDYTNYACTEELCMKLGDKIYDNLFGIELDEVLQLDHVNFKD